MSAVITIRNAIPDLTVNDLEEVFILIEAFKTQVTVLKSEKKIAQNEYKQRNTKLLSILAKIKKIQPSFHFETQTEEELKDYHDALKLTILTQTRVAKKRETLMKKFNDKFPTKICPSDMTNSELETHIKTKLLEDKKSKTEETKLISKKIEDSELFHKISNEIIGPIPKSSTIQDLKKLLNEQKNEEHKCRKFRNIFDDIVKKNPSAGIPNVPSTASSAQLEQSVKDARIKRDAKKRADIELEKQINTQKRADAKAETERNKLTLKILKQKNKENGIKGSQKNGYYQAFTKFITQQVEEGVIDQGEIETAGGKGKYNKKSWSELNNEQKKDPTAPWNLLSITD